MTTVIHYNDSYFPTKEIEDLVKQGISEEKESVTYKVLLETCGGYSEHLDAVLRQHQAYFHKHQLSHTGGWRHLGSNNKVFATYDFHLKLHKTNTNQS